MRLIPVFFFISILSFFISGCSVKVTSSIEADSLKNFHTYSWVELPIEKSTYSRESRRKLIEFDIQKEVEKELTLRGYKKVNDNPDFLLSPKAYLEKEDYTKREKITGPALVNTFGSSSTPSSGVQLVPDNLLFVRLDFLNPTTKDTIFAISRNRIIGGDVMTLSGIIEKDVRSVVKKLPVNK